ncbi:MAG: DUF11 domain-containing protein [Microbacteriaceae bacterium]|nr:DUF11 domain-containing protein [Burkholderiaceae bacterium]
MHLCRIAAATAVLVLTPLAAQATITSVTTQNFASGSAPFDPVANCSQRGHDCNATDLRVRTADTYTVRISLATDGAGATGSTLTMRYPAGPAYAASTAAAGSGYGYQADPLYTVPAPSNCSAFSAFNDGTDIVLSCELVAIAPNTTIDVNIPIRTPFAVLDGASFGLGSVSVTGAAGATLTRNDLPVTLTNAVAPHGQTFPQRFQNIERAYIPGSGPAGADGYIVTYTVARVFNEVSLKSQAGMAVVADLSFSFDEALFTANPTLPAGTLLVSAANGFNVTGDQADGCFVQSAFNYRCDVSSTNATGLSASVVPLTPADAQPLWPGTGGANTGAGIRYWIPASSVTVDPTYLDILMTLTNGATDLNGVQWPDSAPYDSANVNDDHIGRGVVRPRTAGGIFRKQFFRGNIASNTSSTAFPEYFASYRDTHVLSLFMQGGADLNSFMTCDKIDNLAERLTGPAVLTITDGLPPVAVFPLPAHTIEYGVGGAGGAGNTWTTSGQANAGDHASAGCADADSPVWFADPLNPPTGYSTADITRVRLKMPVLPYGVDRRVSLDIPVEMSVRTPASNTGVALFPGTRDVTQTAFTAGQTLPDGMVVYNYALFSSNELSGSAYDVAQVREPKLLWGVNKYARRANGAALPNPTQLGAGQALRFDIEWGMFFNNYYTGQETVTVTDFLSPQFSFQGTPPLPAGVTLTVEPNQPFAGFTRLSWTIATDLAQFGLDPTAALPNANGNQPLRRAAFDLPYFATTNALASSQSNGLANHVTMTSPNARFDCRGALAIGNGTGQFVMNSTPGCPQRRFNMFAVLDFTSNGFAGGGAMAGGETLRFLTDAQAGFQIAKSLNVAGAPIGGFPLNTPFTFDIQWANTDSSTPTLADVRLLDILPYIGDAANGAGAFNGSYRLQSLAFDSNATGSTAYYTSAAPASVNTDPYHSSNAIPGGATIWCLATQFASAGCPANIGASTAVLIVSTAVNYNTLYAARLTIAPSGNAVTDVYTNRAYGRPASLNLVSDDAFAAFAEPLLDVVKTLTAESVAADGIASPAETLTYTLTVRNTGTAPGATTLYEVVPQYTTYVGGSLPCAANAAAGTVCSVATGSIAAGASASYTFSVRVDNALPSSATQVANRAAISSPPPASPTCTASSATVCTPIASASFTVSKTLTTQSVPNAFADAGETLTYTITVTNTGSSARTTTVYEVVPQHTTWVGGSLSCASPAAGSVCSAATGSIAPGSAQTLSFSVRVDSPLPAGVMRIANVVAIDTPPAPISDQDPCVAGPAVVCTPVQPPVIQQIPTLENAALVLLALLLGGLAAKDLRRRRR